MKRWMIIAGGVVLIAVIVIASIKAGGPSGEKVYVENVKREDIRETVSAPGEIDPKLKVNLNSNVIGKIEHLDFKEGDIVHKGQVLVELEQVTYRAQRDRAASDLANRRIEVDRSRVNLANADRSFKRASALQQQGIQSTDLYDRAKNDYDNARSALASAEEGVRQSQAALAQVNDDLSKTTIRSPIDGKVVQLNAHEGEVVFTGTMNNPGSVIAIIADLSEVLVEAEVTETEVVKVTTGQRAKVKVDAVADKEYDAHVVEIGSSAMTRAGSQTGIRYFNVKVAIENPDDRLRPGMTSQVDIITNQAKQVLSVPVQSVVERDPATLKKSKKNEEPADENDALKKKFVFTVVNDKTHAVEVTTGVSDATHVEIRSGLKGTEKVVTGPFRMLKTLKDDVPVKPEKESAAAKTDTAANETAN